MRAARYLEAETGMRIENDRLVDWIDRHDVDITDQEGDRLEVEIGRSVQDNDELLQVLRRGLRCWKLAGWDVERFRRARLRYRKAGRFVYHQPNLGAAL